MKLTLCWRIAVCFALFFGTVTRVQGQNASSTPSVRAFFPLNEPLARDISRTFKVDVQAGLYFTDPQSELLSHEFHVPARGVTLPADASYLIRDEFNDYLYGSKGWKVRGLRRFVREGGIVKSARVLSPVEEFTVEVRWIERPHALDRRMVQQLWLSRRNAERWLLLERDKGEDRSNRLLWIPKYFLPMPDGVLAFPENWMLTRRYFNGQHLTAFNLVTPARGKESRETPDVSFKVARVSVLETNQARHELPLLVHNESERKILFAGWASDKAEAFKNAGVGAVNDARAECELFVLDLSTNRAQRLLTGLTWPFQLALSGVFSTAPGGVRHRGFNWGEDSRTYQLQAWQNVNIDLGKYRPEFRPPALIAVDRQTRARFQLNATGALLPDGPGDELRPVTAAALAPLETWGYPSDLLNELRLGDRHPMYHISRVNERLLHVLNRPEATWATIVYDKGDHPSEMISGFLRALDVGALGSSGKLEHLDSVFRFPSDLFFGLHKRTPFEKALPQLKALLENTRTIGYFEDFPALGEEAVAPKMRDELLGRMKAFNQELGPCIAKGSCRAILSLRREVYQSLVGTPEGKSFFRTANDIEFDADKDFSLGLRKRMARMYAQRQESAFRLGISEDAFVRSFEFVDRLKGVRSEPLRLPGFYENFYLDLFSYSALGLNKDRTNESKEIDRFALNRYLTELTQRPKLEVRDYVKEGEPTPRQTLFWVKGKEEPQRALPELHDQVWRDNPRSLLWSSRYSHAVMRVPGKYADRGITGSPGKSGAVDVLSPNRAPERAVEYVPPEGELALHPQGFYFVYTGQGRMSLAFYSVGGGENPVRILLPAPGQAPVPIEDYTSGNLRVTFENDLAIVTRRNGSRDVYGPRGRIAPAVLSKGEAK